MTSPIAALARQAANKPWMDKLAADTGLSEPQIEKLAGTCEVSVGTLAKWAYANPPKFADLVRRELGLGKQAAPQTTVKQAAAPSPVAAAFVAVAKKAIEKRAEYKRKKTAACLMNHYLDKVAAALPVEKQACVRMLQAQLAAGRTISHAIKVAYPKLTGEQRGILTSKLVKSAADDFKFWTKKKQNGPKTVSGKPGSPEVGKMMKEAAGMTDIAKRVMSSGVRPAGGRVKLPAAKPQAPAAAPAAAPKPTPDAGGMRGVGEELGVPPRVPTSMQALNPQETRLMRRLAQSKARQQQVAGAQAKPQFGGVGGLDRGLNALKSLFSGNKQVMARGSETARGLGAKGNQVQGAKQQAVRDVGRARMGAAGAGGVGIGLATGAGGQPQPQPQPKPAAARG